MEFKDKMRFAFMAFASGEMVDGGELLELAVQKFGHLTIGSGAIAACDPLVEPDPRPFTRVVPNGNHPVEGLLARFTGSDQRIAFARVNFSQMEPVLWEMARTARQDPSKLKKGESFAYGVDSGTGGFMDPAAGIPLKKRMHDDQAFCKAILAEMDATYVHTRSWCNFKVDPLRSENVICFTSGFGDGCYASYFGIDTNGEACTLVTDFDVLTGYPDPIEHAAKGHAWWQFWK